MTSGFSMYKGLSNHFRFDLIQSICAIFACTSTGSNRQLISSSLYTKSFWNTFFTFEILQDVISVSKCSAVTSIQGNSFPIEARTFCHILDHLVDFSFSILIIWNIMIRRFIS